MTTRLQGTDGIRGLVAPDSSGQHPLKFYLDQGLLTPGFFEQYCYAYGLLLIQESLARFGDPVVIGWDPRDPEQIFTSAAMAGLQKAGLNPCQVGVLPTPAIPLYMLHIGAVGAVMLTASHNPADQNGIKLFHPHLGMKFLPKDDERLTAKLYSLSQYDLAEKPLRGDIQDHQEAAREFFIACHRDPANSWLAEDSLKDVILGIDASNGALGPHVSELFSGYGAELHLFCIEGRVNHHCGVAEIEGHEWISPEEVSSGAYQGFPALEGLFALAQKTEVQEGHKKLIGLVFDGDGDRCFRLDYFPDEESFKVLSGDHLGILQASYLAKQGIKGQFVHTVESDLAIAQTASRLGLEPELTGVGDKWILAMACMEWLRLQGQAVGADTLIHLTSQHPARASGFALARACSVQLVEYGLREIEPRFALGLEESGHAITAMHFQSPQGPRIAYAGNGAKAGLNALAATTNMPELNLREPFIPGVKKTYYVYYVKRGELIHGSPFLEAFHSQLTKAVAAHLDSGVSLKVKTFMEEADLAFFELWQKGKPQGAIFLRNSGTEDKSALYLRGPARWKTALLHLGEELHQGLLADLKQKSKSLCQLELSILSAISQGQEPQQGAHAFEGSPWERVLAEMERKEGVVTRENGLFKVTPKGLYLLKQMTSS